MAQRRDLDPRPVGREFVLLAFAGLGTGTDELTAAATKRGVPLRIVTISDPAVAELQERPHVLVRPDGHVAWRGHQVPDDVLGLIDTIRGAGKGAQPVR